MHVGEESERGVDIQQPAASNITKGPNRTPLAPSSYVRKTFIYTCLIPISYYGSPVSSSVVSMFTKQKQMLYVVS